MPHLDLQDIASATLKQFAGIGLKPDELAITLVTFNEESHLSDFHGDQKVYPASIIKLFYLVAAHRWLEDGLLEDTPELRRAMKDMIADSSNDATHYVVDLLTGTTSGPELPEDQMVEWAGKRNQINEFFSSLGYQGINVKQKPWSDGPYGRERVFVGADYENRNLLTTNATARLLSDIVTGKSVSRGRSLEMMAVLERDYQTPSSDPDHQGLCFSGKSLPPGSRLWSKAGWTSTARHDAAYIELADGRRFVLVTFTVNHAKQHGIIPFVADKVIKGYSG